MENKPLTTAKEWRDKGRETEVIELPSGVIIEILKPNLLNLVFAGTLPLSLANSLEAVGKRMKSGKLNDEDIQEVGKLTNDVLIVLAVNPKVVATGTATTESEISVDDIQFSDKFDFFQQVMDVGGTSKKLEPFRKVEQRPDTGGGGGAVRKTPKRNKRNKKTNKRT